MNSFWNNLYDWSKDRRYAALFLVTFIIFLGLAIPGVILYLNAKTLSLRPGYAVPGTCGLVVTLTWTAIRRVRRRRRHRSAFSPLSRDELAKARSKLVKERTFRKL